MGRWGVLLVTGALSLFWREAIVPSARHVGQWFVIWTRSHDAAFMYHPVQRFQLSLFGTAGVVMGAAPLEHRLHRLPALLREGLAVTVAAQLATIPLVANGFGQVSVVGPVANALCVPLMALCMAVGGVGAVVSLAIPGLAHAAGWVVYPLLWAMTSIVQGLANVPASFVAVPAFNLAAAAVYVALLLLGMWWALPEAPRPAIVQRFLPGRLPPPAPRPTRHGHGRAFGVGVLALAITVGWQAPPPHMYRVTFINTGGGQAVLVQTPDRQAVLIDGGNGATELRQQLGSVLPFWERDLAMVLLSSTDRAHVAGLLGLATTYTVHASGDAGTFYPSADYALWRADLRQSGVRYMRLQAGQRVVLDGHAAIDVLEPTSRDVKNAQGPVGYRLWIGQISVLLVNRQALAIDPTTWQTDVSPVGGGAPGRDTVVALPLLPQRGNAAWNLLALDSPAVAVLPSQSDVAALTAQTGPVETPAGTGQAWQGAQDSRLVVWTDGTRYGVQIVP